MEKQRFVGYCRISKGNVEGLGGDGQEAAIRKWAKGKGRVLRVFREDVSGVRAAREKRIVLNEAMAEAKRKGATLVVAKLDRLGRDIRFLEDIKEKKIGFRAVDFPGLNTLGPGTSAATTLLLEMMAVISRYEHGLISERTKAALAMRKRKGLPMGAQIPRIRKALEKSKRPRRENKPSRIGEEIAGLRESGWSYRKIAKRFTRLKRPTRAGGKWHPGTIRKIYLREGGVHGSR